MGINGSQTEVKEIMTNLKSSNKDPENDAA